MPSSAPAADRRNGVGRVLFAWGTILLLAGDVLPWLRSSGETWPWEFSLWWVLTGNLERIATPPAAGAVILLCGLACAFFFLRGPRSGGALPAAVAGLAIGVCGLTLFRAFTFAGDPLRPSIGLVASFVGAVLAGAGTLFEGDA